MYRVRFWFRDARLIRLDIANDHDDPLLTWEKGHDPLAEIEALVGRDEVLSLIREFWRSLDPEGDLVQAEETARDVRIERFRTVAEAFMGDE